MIVEQKEGKKFSKLCTLVLCVSYVLYFITEDKYSNLGVALKDALYTALLPTSHLRICISH